MLGGREGGSGLTLEVLLLFKEKDAGFSFLLPVFIRGDARLLRLLQILRRSDEKLAMCVDEELWGLFSGSC